MSLLNVLTYPDPFLKTKAQPVSTFDASLKKLTDDMFETMYEENGIGLAAVQIGKDMRLVVVDVPPENSEIEENNPMVLINPEILQEEGQSCVEEGCLSVPEYRAEVERAESIKVRFQDVEGNRKELEAEGLLSICIQHEIDHLDGILFIDHLSPLKRNMVQKKLKKQAKANR